MTGARPDLLALSDDSLATLANRGIVKRSAREVAEGKGPTIALADDGTVTGTFADGTRVILPPATTVEQAPCTCPASGVCRHRVMTVIAFRATAATNEEPGAGSTTGAGAGSAAATPIEPGAPDRPSDAPAVWSPGRFSDDDLEDQLGTRVLALARKARRTGYRAQVRRPTTADPVPTVELPSCTVRFLVPDDLAYARVDAARGTREDAIALAVWAFRAADAASADAADPTPTEVEVGGAHTVEHPATGGSGVEPALDVLTDLFADGAVHVGEAFGPSIVQTRRALEKRNLRWPIDALDELSDQLAAYQARSARYNAVTVAALIAELVARHRSVVGGGSALRPGVLGTEEAAETPLRLLRLSGLGARIVGDGDSRTVEVYLAHAEAGVVLTLRRRVEVDTDDDREPPSAEDLGRRKSGGVRLAALAGGNVVTESAVRAANRSVRLAASRVARTTATPSTGAWDGLPASILIDDLDAEHARQAETAPSVVRPRVLAEAIRVLPVDRVDDLAYQPGEQRLAATVHSGAGRATISLTHTAAAAGAIDALAEALGDASGPVRYIAGHVRRHAGGLVVEPTAVVTGATVIVPAFSPTPAAAGTPMASTTDVDRDPLATALEQALQISAEVPHRGRRHLPPGWTTRAEQAAQQLRRVNLTQAATSLSNLATAPDLAAWADTHLRLLITTEQL